MTSSIKGIGFNLAIATMTFVGLEALHLCLQDGRPYDPIQEAKRSLLPALSMQVGVEAINRLHSKVGSPFSLSGRATPLGIGLVSVGMLAFGYPPQSLSFPLSITLISNLIRHALSKPGEQREMSQEPARTSPPPRGVIAPEPVGAGPALAATDSLVQEPASTSPAPTETSPLEPSIDLQVERFARPYLEGSPTPELLLEQYQRIVADLSSEENELLLAKVADRFIEHYLQQGAPMALFAYFSDHITDASLPYQILAKRICAAIPLEGLSPFQRSWVETYPSKIKTLFKILREETARRGSGEPVLITDLQQMKLYTDCADLLRGSSPITSNQIGAFFRALIGLPHFLDLGLRLLLKMKEPLIDPMNCWYEEVGKISLHSADLRGNCESLLKIGKAIAEFEKEYDAFSIRMPQKFWGPFESAIGSVALFFQESITSGADVLSCYGRFVKELSDIAREKGEKMGALENRSMELISRSLISDFTSPDGKTLDTGRFASLVGLLQTAELAPPEESIFRSSLSAIGAPHRYTPQIAVALERLALSGTVS